MLAQTCRFARQKRWLLIVCFCLVGWSDMQSTTQGVVQAAPYQGWRSASRLANSALVMTAPRPVNIRARSVGHKLEAPDKLITGFVRHDINHNGHMDDGEPGLADIQVELWGQPPDLPVQLCTSTTTDQNGFYGFNNEYAPWCTTVRIEPTAKYPIIGPINDHDFVLDEGIKTWLPLIDSSQVSGIVKQGTYLHPELYNQPAKENQR